MTIKRRNHGSGHSYVEVDADGTETKVPGVTTLLGDALPKQALQSWYAKMAAEEAVNNWDELAGLPIGARYERIYKAPWNAMSEAGVRGTEVHGLAERLSAGEEVDVPEHLAAYVDSCVKFLDEWQAVPVVTERPVINRAVGYAGTFDAVMEMTRCTWLLDWKTGKGVYADSTLQLVAYARAEHYLDEHGVEQPMRELGITRAGIVHIRPDGYDVYETDISEVAWLACRHAMWMGRLLHREKGRTGWRSGLDDFLLGRRSAS